MTFVQFGDCWFGGDPRRFSDMFTFSVNHLHNNFAEFITGDSLKIWLPHNLDLFREAICNRLSESFVVEVKSFCGV